MYALTIFLSAFLIFQLQPMISKFILPWFGGTPAVWSTCLAFFQLALCGGYIYSHFIVRYLTPARQALVHSILLLITMWFFLPVAPEDSWKSAEQSMPALNILLLLFATVGAPYFMLASTAPLLQSWFSTVHHGKSPFRLYALSNLGSLLALMSYPFAFEPALTLRLQTVLWSSGYVLFAILCVGSAVQLVRRTRLAQGGATEQVPLRVASNSSGAVSHDNILLWMFLAATGSAMLMATTNQLCLDVASVPFLWVVPLAVYLITFIICFDSPSWYRRPIFSAALIIGIVASTSVIYFEPPIVVQIATHVFTLFACCMCCHGELVRLRPDVSQLTLFYLAISAGGALGGMLVAFVAPVVFDTIIEFPIAMASCCMLILIVRRRERGKVYGRPAFAGLLVVAGLGAMGLDHEQVALTGGNGDVVAQMRSFYGAVRVMHDESASLDTHRLSLVHGTTLHGFQLQSPERRNTPTMYYTNESGIGVAVSNHPRRSEDAANLKIGVIGLGVGTIASYAREGDHMHFYEINPDVVHIANTLFTFLEDAIRRGAILHVDVGDARLVLEDQLLTSGAQRFDILAVDAFSSDSIPTHLLTKECFEIYWSHLKTDGVLAVHVSNRHLNLAPVVRTLAESTGHEPVLIVHEPSVGEEPRSNVAAKSDWVLITGNEKFLASKPVAKSRKTQPSDSRSSALWTDDFSNVFSVIQW